MYHIFIILGIIIPISSHNICLAAAHKETTNYALLIPIQRTEGLQAITAHLTKELQKFAEDIKQKCPTMTTDLRIEPQEDYHVTLLSIGQIPDHTLECVENTILTTLQSATTSFLSEFEGAYQPYPIPYETMQLTMLGHAAIVTMAPNNVIGKSFQLTQLLNDTIIKNCNIPVEHFERYQKDKNNFIPHITLALIKPQSLVKKFKCRAKDMRGQFIEPAAISIQERFITQLKSLENNLLQLTTTKPIFWLSRIYLTKKTGSQPSTIVNTFFYSKIQHTWTIENPTATMKAQEQAQKSQKPLQQLHNDLNLLSLA